MPNSNNNFLNLQPVLSSKEQKRITKYKQNPWEDLYHKEQEKELYGISKVLRKEQNLPKTKFNPTDIDSYKELIINKPKLSSIAGNLYEEYIKPKVKPEVKQLTSTLLSQYGEVAKTGIQKTTKTVAQVLDKVDEPIKKKVLSVSVPAGVAYYNLKNLYGDKKVTVDETIKGSQDIKTQAEYLFGTKNDSNYLDFSTATEKRRQIYDGATPELKQRLDKIEPYTLFVDVAAGIASGHAVSKIIPLAITKAGGLTTKTGKLLNILDKTINPSLDNMAKAGAVVGTSALAYYEATGKWLFDGDKQSEEGAFALLGSLGLKGAGQGAKWIYDFYKNPSVQKGVQSVFENAKNILGDKAEQFAEYSGAKVNLLGKEGDLKEVDNLYNKNNRNIISQLSGQQSVKGGYINEQDALDLKSAGIEAYDTVKSPDKVNNIKRLLDNGVLEFAGTDKKGLRFIWTAQALASKLETPGEGYHFNPKQWNEFGGGRLELPKKEVTIKEDIDIKDPIKEDKIDKMYEALNKQDIERTIENKQKSKTGFWEGKAKEDGLWNEKKSKASNIFSYVLNKSGSKFVKNQFRVMGQLLGDTPVNWKLDKAKKPVEETLREEQLYGKLNRINSEFENISKEVGDDYADFNAYLWQKSRLAKTISEEAKGNTLKTVSISPDGTKIEWTKELLSRANKKDGKYGILADRLYNINKQTLDLEVDAGVRTREEADNFFANNPYYIPDKLELDGIDGFIKAGDFTGQGLKGTKKLKGGSEDFSFGINSMEVLAKSIAYRTRVAQNSKLFNTLLEADNGLGIIKEVKVGAPAREGYSVATLYKEGERKLIEVPTFFKQFIDEGNQYRQSTTLNILGAPASAIKFFSTGAWNLKFQLIAPTWEIPSAIIKNTITGGSNIDYLKALKDNIIPIFRTKNSYYNTPEGKIALKALLSNYGADFTGIKQFQKEFDIFAGKEEGMSFVKTSKGKLGELYESFTHLGHKIEVATTRAPLFEAGLKKLGIDGATWNKLAKQYTNNGYTDVNGLVKALKSKGANPAEVASVTRSLYDYNSAATNIDTAAKFIPYINRGVNNIVALKNLFDNNPKKFLAVMGVITGAAYEMYNHNYSGENGEKLRTQSAFLKTKVGLLTSIDTEEGKLSFSDIGRNIQALEWVYPMVVAYNEGSGYSAALNKIVKDVTYIGDLTKPSFVDLSKLPPVVKQIFEIANNKDYFYDTELIPEWKKSEFKTQDYNKYTNPLVVKFSKTWALLTGGKTREDGFIEGGQQVSPVILEKALSTADPSGVILDSASVLLNNILDLGVTDSNVSKFKGLITKTYNLTSNNSNGEGLITDEKLKSEIAPKATRAAIRERLSKATTIQELESIKEDLKAQYQSSEYYKSDYKDILKSELKDKRIEINYGKEFFYINKLSPEEQAYRLINIFQSKGLQEVKVELNSLREKGVSEERITNIKEEYKKIKKSLEK